MTTPNAWLRTPRTGQSAIDKACAVEIREGTKQSRIDWIVAALFVGVLVAIALGAL